MNNDKWEKELMQLEWIGIHESGNYFNDYDKLKAFISTLLAEQRREVIEIAQRRCGVPTYHGHCSCGQLIESAIRSLDTGEKH